MREVVVNFQRRVVEFLKRQLNRFNFLHERAPKVVSDGDEVELQL